MQKLQYDDLDTDKLASLIRNKHSFEVDGLSGRMGLALAKIENAIEDRGLTCRVYTQGRVAIAGESLFGGITDLVGLTAHNLATYLPDYEISKHMADNALGVFYKK